MPRLCVALCTYNGQRFLGEQLASISAQSRLPDRLLVVDDRSEDATAELVREFARSAGFPVDMRINETNLGYVRNFERALRLADGEVIVLSDQDDVWHPGRLRLVEEAFASYPTAGLVFSDAELVDEQGSPLGERLWEVVGFNPAKQRMAEEGRLFEVLVKGSVVTGATLALRSRFLPRLLPFVDGVTHDAWLALLLAALAPAVIIREPLVRYRQHDGNQIGARRISPLQRLRRARGGRVDGLEMRRLQHSEALARLENAGVPSDRLELLRESIAHLGVRVGLPASRSERLPRIIEEVSSRRYARLSDGLPSALRDLLA